MGVFKKMGFSGFTKQQGAFVQPTLFDRRKFVSGFSVMVLSGFLAMQPGRAQDAWLTWRNGDSLKGEMLATDGESGALRWKSELFTKPFDIELDQLQMVRFGSDQKLPESKEGFRITLMTGDVLPGNLVSISSDKVTIKSARLQDGKNFEIARKQVASIERIYGNGIMLTGPHSQREWKSVGRERKIGDWIPTPEGRLGTKRWHGDLFRPFKFPRKSETRFTLKSLLNPLEFTVGFYLDPGQGPAIETWDDTIVLTYGNDFEPLMEVSSGTKNLTLRVFWDREKGVISAHNADGKMLGKIEGAKGPVPTNNQNQNRRRTASGRNGNPKDEGFSLLNKSTDIFLGDLRVRAWDGKYPSEIQSDKPRIEFVGGSADYGNVVSASSSTLKLSGGRSKRMTDVNHIIFDLNPRNPNLPEKPEERNIYVAWLDGTVLSGKMQSITGEKVSILPTWSDKPVEALLGSTRKIAFFGNGEGEEGDGSKDVLYVKSQILKGRLVADEESESDSLLLWQPPGAKNASPMAAGLAPRVVRGTGDPGEVKYLGSGYVYLTNNEVVSGKLLSITGKKIHFQSDYTGQVALDPEVVRAIDITAFAGELSGFTDPGWQKFPDETLGESSMTLDKEEVVLKKGAFGHPSLLAGDVVRFNLEWKQPYMGALTLKLFTGDLKGAAPSKDIVFMGQGQQMYVGEFNENGQFSYSGQRVNMKNGRISVVITHSKDRIVVKADGTEVMNSVLDQKSRSGNGIVFKEGGWQGFARNDTQVTVSEFKVLRTPGFLPTRIVDPDVKKEALRIPRFSRENPPSHVLIAQNGDILRGKLIAASGDSIRFSSKLDTFDFPRDRVATIIFLKPPREGDSEGEKGSDQSKEKDVPKESKDPFLPTHRFVMNDGSRFALKAESVVDGRMVGQSELLGKCEVPSSPRYAREIRMGPAKTKTAKDNIVVAYNGWRLENAPEPVIPTDDGGESSPLVGVAARDFKLPMLDGGEFKLSDQKGKKVVVLDFWATWCGPCIRAMPEIFRGTAPFGDKIAFLAVNQGETPPIIEQFLNQRGWAGIPVGLDVRQTIGDQFQVQGIPHTVVIGKDGKIAWVHSGYKEGMGRDLANAIAKALQN